MRKGILMSPYKTHMIGMLKNYMKEAARPHILTGVSCALLGIAAAAHYGRISLPLALLLLVGAALAQAAVTILDDYFDFRSGLDKETKKTKFSGGSPLIAGGKITAAGTLVLGMFTFAAGAAISVYLMALYPIIIPLVAVGIISTLFYPTVLVRVPFLAEIMASLNEAFIAIASFIVAGGLLARLPSMLFVAFPAGIVIGGILLANEVPDRKVDVKYGRKTAAVLLSSNHAISGYYAAMQAFVFAIVLIGVASSNLPMYELAVFALAPLAVYVYRGIRAYRSPSSYERFMAANTAYSLLLVLLLAVCYIL